LANLDAAIAGVLIAGGQVNPQVFLRLGQLRNQLANLNRQLWIIREIIRRLLP
jgi:hypothetical protein